jgi:ribonuclease HI
MYTLRFDGLFRGLPGGASATAGAGFMSYGWLIFMDDQIIARGHGVFARRTDATSNVAEYLGLIEGLEALSDLGLQKHTIVVCGDAKSIIEQMQGTAMVVSQRMKPLYRRAKQLAAHCPNLVWSWTPRRMNREADLLTRRAIRQVHLDPLRYQAAIEALQPGGKGQQSALFSLVDLRLYQQSSTPAELV